MPRPKSMPEEAVLDAALRVMNRLGPAGLTFAALAAEAGLSPAALVQRHGSREGLVRAALLRAWDLLDAATAAADTAAGPGAEGAMAVLIALTGEDHDPLGQGLLLLTEDMRDPVLRARGTAWGRALALALGRRLAGKDEAETELRGRLMASQWQGALLWWGFCRQGRLIDYVRGELLDWCRIVERSG